MIKKHLFHLLPIFFILGFTAVYAKYLFSILPYGDSTIHMFHVNTLLEQGWKYVQADYPIFYYYIVGYLDSLYGQNSYNIVVLIGVFLILSYSFLFARKVTHNPLVHTLVVVLVGLSPKIIFYSFRMYQEIFLTSIFLMTVYYLFCFIKGDYHKRDFYIMLFFTAVAICIKQQGVLILYPSIFLFLCFLTFRKKTNIKKVVTFLLVSAILGLPFYGILFHNRGIFLIGNSDFLSIRLANYLGQTIFGYSGKDKIKTLSDAFKVPEILEQVDIGSISFQERQLTFQKTFSDLQNFSEIHTIFTSSGSYGLYSSLQYILAILLLLGSVTFVVETKNKHRQFLVFIAIFLVINYILFMRNTDQARYHLFIPFVLILFFIFGLQSTRKHKYALLFLCFFIFLNLGLLSVGTFQRSFNAATRSQVYASSVGGIASIEQAGAWARIHIPIDANVLHTCGNEFQYYSRINHVVTLDSGEVYFYERKRLEGYIYDRDINYVVILKSQIVDDRSWNNFCKVPEIFFKNIDASFTRIFTSDLNDIFIYEVQQK